VESSLLVEYLYRGYKESKEVLPSNNLFLRVNLSIQLAHAAMIVIGGRFDKHSRAIFCVGYGEAIRDINHSIVDPSQQSPDHSVVFFLLPTDEMVQNTEDDHGLDLYRFEGLSSALDVQRQCFVAHGDWAKKKSKWRNRL
jgi:hypothetical protein